MRIYVGNLAYGITDQELEEAFAPFGQVESAQVVTDRYSGRSKGFGFVEMADKEQAEAAIASLNAKELSGRALTVNEARPRPERSFGGGGGGGGDSRW
ncbi:MAG: RNA recognition motif-containing protein [Chloroflexi bacterium]|jgi:RNA recognition motif-containing protein|nr:MAG: RNA recognition motif-containing protein [Chloroflexota bacterium]